MTPGNEKAGADCESATGQKKEPQAPKTIEQPTEQVNHRRLHVAWGEAGDLGTITRQESITLDALAAEIQQAQDAPVDFTFGELSAARAALKAAKVARDDAQLVGVTAAELKGFSTRVKTMRARVDRMKRARWITCGKYSSSRRDIKSLQSGSAIVCDADQQGVKLASLVENLNALNCSYLLHTSTSHGCEGQERYRAIISLAQPIEPGQYAAVWEHVNAQCGGVFDPGAKDPPRLNYLPRVPTGATGHQVICVSDRPWFDASSISAPIGSPSTALSPSDPLAFLATISAEQKDHLLLAAQYPAFLESLKDQGAWSDFGHNLLSIGDTGREIFCQISKLAPNYEPGADIEWWEAHKHYAPRSDFRAIYKKAATLGWSNPGLVAGAGEFLPATQTSALQRIGRRLVCNASNAQAVLQRQTEYQFAYDDFAGRRMIRGPEDAATRALEDEDITKVQIYLQQNGLLTIGHDTTRKAIELQASFNRIAGPADWLNGLTWDRERRLSLVCVRGFGTKFDRYHIRAFRNMFIAMVARALLPGCKVDECVVLEGRQGSHKSSAFRVIGGQWYRELIAQPHDKDFEQQLRGVWLGEFPELNALRRPDDIAKIKQFITNDIDHFRPTYGHEEVDRPRRSVLCGTTNDPSWLHDPTGGRRFIPVRVGKIDLQWLKENREQLFAEATVLYQAERKWWIYPSEEALAQQEDRMEGDPWTNSIRAYLCGRIEIGDLSELLTQAVGRPLDRQTKADQTRIGIILNRLGCVRQPQRRVDGTRRRPWSVPADIAQQPRSDFSSIAVDPVLSDPLLRGL